MVADGLDWVLLAYRIPREPSTPRIAVWRRLKRLGAAQIGDGLVALPADARTMEQLDWVAEQVGEAGGASTTWRARLTSAQQERRLVGRMQADRAAEYRAILAKARAAAEEATTCGDGGRPGLRTLRSLRRELRDVQRRDYFPPPERDLARAALREYAEAVFTREVERAVP